MNIRLKILLTIGTFMAVIVLLEVVILNALTVNYIEKEELKFIEQDYSRAESMLEKEESILNSTLRDWSQWDDSYQFMLDKNFEFMDASLCISTLGALNLNFMCYYDKKGGLYYPLTNGLKSSQKQTFLSEISKLVKTDIKVKKFWTANKPISGLLMVSGKPVLVALSPISNSDSTAPPKGVLAIGRYLDIGYKQYLEEVLQTGVSFEAVDKPGLSDVLSERYKKVLLDKKLIWVSKKPDKISSYSIISDIYGAHNIYLVFNLPREIYMNGIQAVQYARIFFFVMIFIVTAVSIIVIDRIVTRPIKTLHSFMRTVGDSKDTAAKVFLPGKDEISELAEITNNMLGELDAATSDVKISEKRFRLIMEATNDGYFDWNLMQNKLYVSLSWLEKMGYQNTKDFSSFENYIPLVHPDDQELFQNAFDDCLEGKIEEMYFECRAIHKSGEWNWILIRGKLAEFDQEGKPARLIGTISDISRQKKIEENNIYLSRTDVITELNNRAYMENLLKNAHLYGCHSWWVILGDVNGLQAINERYGHKQGDKLLLRIGEILKKCCSDTDIPGRWGGGEFIIFINGKDAAYVDDLISRIKDECNNVSDYLIKFSIALGCARKDPDHSDMDEVLKLAEERMNRNKLLDGLSARNSVISSLEQSLHEKNIETEEHTRRIKHMCNHIGKGMGLTQAELDELKLLGVLHDIGKIGIPEAVLLKPGKLTEDEWKIMKTHSEIGSRIASSTPVLTIIADKILYHHERYDGTGYPHGLKGRDIPELSRLISIIDSFDVMTHDRPYKKAISIESAFEELKRCAGTQFDPELVPEVTKLLKKLFPMGKITEA